MEEYYEVSDGNAVVGKVQLIHEGLYYRIICRCQLSGDLVRRLYAVTESRRENIGVLVPEGDGFVLERRIPTKKLSGSNLQFHLSSGGSKLEGKVVPVCPEEPFLYMDRLKNAFLESENGKVNIRIEETPKTV